MSSEEYQKQLRAETDAFLKSKDEVLVCPRCGMKSPYTFQHYEYCRIGLQIQRDGYVIGWIKRLKEANIE